RRTRLRNHRVPWPVRRAPRKGVRAAQTREAAGALDSERRTVTCLPYSDYECGRALTCAARCHRHVPATLGARRRGEDVGSRGISPGSGRARADAILRQPGGVMRERERAVLPDQQQCGKTALQWCPASLRTFASLYLATMMPPT